MQNSLVLTELSPQDVPATIRTELRALACNDTPADLVFTPDGRYAAVAIGRDVLLIDGRRGRALRVLKGSRSEIRDLSFCIRGPYLAGIADDGTLMIWNWLSGMQEVTVNAHRTGGTRVAHSCDGGILATVGDGGDLRYWIADVPVDTRPCCEKQPDNIISDAQRRDESPEAERER